jgi:uncharacterized protein YeaO (DUF488 family)
MHKYISTLFSILFLTLIACDNSQSNKSDGAVWSKEKTWNWYNSQPWLVGSNFITSSSINQLEFWQSETFDLNLIDEELKLSASIGMNTHRVYLHDLLWKQDSIGFINRIDQFLEIADKYGIKIMFVFFDDVWHPYPSLGKQPDPIPHIHNSGWVQSPGVEILTDTLKHDSLEPYVKGIVSRFKDDERVLAWDLYNEPAQHNGAPRVSKERVLEIYKNIGVILSEEELPKYYRDKMEPTGFEKRKFTLALLKKVFSWVRDINPSQPLTVGIYDYNIDWDKFDELLPLEQYILNNSDFISFHDYGNKESVIKRIKHLKIYERPIVCTEYIARGQGNTFENILPIFKENIVGGYNWGLVSGKTNTIYPWKSWDSIFKGPPKEWHHDIFYPNGEPFSVEEVELIKKLTSSVNFKN